jgi:hypothetical protein
MHSPCKYCEVYPNWEPPKGSSYCKIVKCKWYYKWGKIKEAK